MKADRKKLELAMARACMNSADLPVAAGLPRPTVQNAIVGKGVRPATLGRIAKALGVDPAELLDLTVDKKTLNAAMKRLRHPDCSKRLREYL